MLLFADFFALDGCKIIAVSEFFDSQLGDIVSPRSLHGQFIQSKLGGLLSAFNDLVNPSLSKCAGEEVVRAQGRRKRFAIGTTAVFDHGGERYFFVALTHADPITHKVDAGLPELWQCLDGLWRTVRNGAGDRTVNMPLIGGKFSGIGLPSAALIQLLLTSIVYETKKRQITSEIRVVLHESLVEEIDLKRIAREWA